MLRTMQDRLCSSAETSTSLKTKPIDCSSKASQQINKTKNNIKEKNNIKDKNKYYNDNSNNEGIHKPRKNKNKKKQIKK